MMYLNSHLRANTVARKISTMSLTQGNPADIRKQSLYVQTVTLPRLFKAVKTSSTFLVPTFTLSNRNKGARQLIFLNINNYILKHTCRP
jgi:hypothetical protein